MRTGAGRQELPVPLAEPRDVQRRRAMSDGAGRDHQRLRLTDHGFRTQSEVSAISGDRSTTSKLPAPIELKDWAVIPCACHLAVVVRSLAKVSAIWPPSDSSIPYFLSARRITLWPALYG